MTEYVLFKDGIEIERGNISGWFSDLRTERYCSRRSREDGDLTYSINYGGIVMATPISQNRMNEILARPIDFDLKFPKLTGV